MEAEKWWCVSLAAVLLLCLVCYACADVFTYLGRDADAMVCRASLYTTPSRIRHPSTINTPSLHLGDDPAFQSLIKASISCS